MGPVRVPRTLPALTLLVLALLLAVGPLSACGAAAAQASPAAVASAADCTGPPALLCPGAPDQVPRRSDDDPPAPAVAPDTPVAVVPAGHDATTLPEPPATGAPSPVEELCVDRN